MNGIKEYLIQIVTFAATGVIAELILSSLSERHPGIEKIARLGITLCVMASIVIPVISKGIPDLEFDYKSMTESFTSDADSMYLIEKEAESETCAYIFEQTGIKPQGVRINIEMKDTSSVEITSAEIILNKKDADSQEEVIGAGREALGTEVKVKYAE